MISKRDLKERREKSDSEAMRMAEERIDAGLVQYWRKKGLYLEFWIPGEVDLEELARRYLVGGWDVEVVVGHLGTGRLRFR